MPLLDLRTAFTQLKNGAGTATAPSKLKPYHFWYGPGPAGPTLLVNAKSAISDKQIPAVNGKKPPAQDSCRGRLSVFDADDGLELHLFLKGSQKPSDLKTGLLAIAKKNSTTLKRVNLLNKEFNDEVSDQQSKANRQKLDDAVKALLDARPTLAGTVATWKKEEVADDEPVSTDTLSEGLAWLKDLELRMAAFEKSAGNAALAATQRNTDGETGKTRIKDLLTDALALACAGNQKAADERLRTLTEFGSNPNALADPDHPSGGGFEARLLGAATAARKRLMELSDRGTITAEEKTSISGTLAELVQGARERHGRGGAANLETAERMLRQVEALATKTRAPQQNAPAPQNPPVPGNRPPAMNRPPPKPGPALQNMRGDGNAHDLQRQAREDKQSDLNALATAARRGDELLQKPTSAELVESRVGASQDADQRRKATEQQHAATQKRVDELKGQPGGLARGYELGDPKGSGAFSYVVELNSKTDQSSLILKVNKNASRDEIEKEAAAAKALGVHPNIAQYFGTATVDGKEGIVMENVQGGTVQDFNTELNTRLKNHEISESEYWGALQFNLAKTLEALVFVEEQGYVHGDLKPANIMIDRATGEPKLIDLGSMTRKDDRPGKHTPGLQAPDSGNTIAHDVFAVGAMAYMEGEDRESFYKGRPGSKDFEFLAYGAQNNVLTEGGTREIPKDWRELPKPGIKLETPPAQRKPDDPDVGAPSPADHKPGSARADTAYVDFVNLLTHPDPAVRLSPKAALQHPFMKDRLLGDEQARTLIKGIVTPVEPAPQPLDVRVTSMLNQAVNVRGDLDATAAKVEVQIDKLAKGEALKAEETKGLDDDKLMLALRKGNRLLGDIGNLMKEVHDSKGGPRPESSAKGPSGGGPRGQSPLPTQTEALDASRRPLNVALGRLAQALKDRQKLVKPVQPVNKG